jgi:hypothetical protein
MQRSLVLLSLCVLYSCEDSMRDQSRIKPLEPTPFFEDNRSSRTPIDGTVARGHLNEDTEFYAGKKGGVFVAKIPVPVSKDIVLRGQERFGIYCAACHGADGYGKGIIVRRGFIPPPSYHTSEMRGHPDGYFFDVITHGKGAMYPYASRISVPDRWAIVSYIRALQLSQYSAMSDIPETQRRALEDSNP